MLTARFHFRLQGVFTTENFVGSHVENYDCFIVLSHFKGHSMAGFGGAIKNLSIGIASAEGKYWIHSAGTSTTDWVSVNDHFLESMAEAGKAVSDYLDNGKNIVYINVMNKLSIDCDCHGHPAEPLIADIGILASTDPVALDQACVDLIYLHEEGDAALLCYIIDQQNGQHLLEHAEEIGLGNRKYDIVPVY